jgi:hypothetical protein
MIAFPRGTRAQQENRERASGVRERLPPVLMNVIIAAIGKRVNFLAAPARWHD